MPPSIRADDEVEQRWVIRGNNVSLTCDADAVPPPTIHWLVNGVPLVPSPRIRRQQGGKILFISFAKVNTSYNLNFQRLFDSTGISTVFT